MNDLRIEAVNSRTLLNQYIFLPEKIHSDHKNWVPPIYSDEKKYYNPKKNPGLKYCDSIQYLAYRNGKPVGRIMGIINHRHNEEQNEKTARWSFFDSYNDAEAADALFNAVETWAREKGMNRIIGPFGMHGFDPEGMQIDGFDEEVSVSSNNNFPYIIDLIEANGYEKEIDMVVYKMAVPDNPPEIYQKVAERVASRGYDVVNLRNKKDLKKYVLPVLHLINETFTVIYGFHKLTDEELSEFAKQYITVLDPELVKIIEKDGEVVACVVAMGNISEGVRKARGRLFPFGFIKVFRAMKTTKQLDLLLGAVLPKYQGLGLDMLMGYEMLKTAKKKGFTVMDSHLELEDNYKVRAEMERIGGKVYKRFRVFQKDL